MDVKQYYIADKKLAGLYYKKTGETNVVNIRIPEFSFAESIGKEGQ